MSATSARGANLGASMNEGDIGPWTERELLAALKAAGWKRVRGSPARTYVSPDGVLFQMDEYRQETGVLWRYYAARRTLPEALQPWQVRLRERMRGTIESAR